MRRFVRRSSRPMSCKQVARRLQHYLDGELDELTTRRVLGHLEDCRRCGMEIEVYEEIKASLARREQQEFDEAAERLRAFSAQLLREGPDAITRG